MSCEAVSGRSRLRLVHIIESQAHMIGRGVGDRQQQLLLKVRSGAIGAFAGAKKLTPSHLAAKQGFHHGGDGHVSDQNGNDGTGAMLGPRSKLRT